MAYPIKITKRTEILPVIILVSVWSAAVYFYRYFPDRVVNHWNFAGQPDAFTGRLQGAIAIPIILTFMYVMFLGLPWVDPKRERYADFEKVYRGIRAATLGLLAAIYMAAGLYNLGYPVEIGKVTTLLVGILMIFLGNLMGKLKKNWFVGIKTPWTLSSDNVWNNTHRVGGWLFVLFGLITMAAPYLPQSMGMGLFFGGVFMVSIGTMAYSYWVYRQEKK